MVTCIPAIETLANIRAAEIATRQLNAGYLTVMLEGKYTDEFLVSAGKNAPKYTTEDLSIISAPIDFVGPNVYRPEHYVVAVRQRAGDLLWLSRFPHRFRTWNRTGSKSAPRRCIGRRAMWRSFGM